MPVVNPVKIISSKDVLLLEASDVWNMKKYLQIFVFPGIFLI